MASPTLAGTNNNSQDAQATPITCNLPASISSGNLLLLFVDFNGAATATTPTGWSVLSGFPLISGNFHAYGWYKKATGSEGASVSVTVTASVYQTTASARITGWDGTTAPDVAVNSANNSKTPPALAPAGGSQNYLWLGYVANNNSEITAGSSGWSGYASSGAPTYDYQIAWDYLQATASSETPGAFTSILTGFTWTIAVTPPVGAAFATAPAAVSAVTAALTIAPHAALAGTLAATSAVTGAAILTAIQLNGTVAAMSAAVAPVLTTAIIMLGPPAAQSAVTAALTTAIPLAGTSASQSAAVAPALTTQIQLLTAPAGQSAVTAATLHGIAAALAAEADGGSAITADLTNAIRVNGEADAASALTAALTTVIRLVGAPSATSVVTAALTAQIQLVGAAAGQSAVAGDL